MVLIPPTLRELSRGARCMLFEGCPSWWCIFAAFNHVVLPSAIVSLSCFFLFVSDELIAVVLLVFSLSHIPFCERMANIPKASTRVTQLQRGVKPAPPSHTLAASTTRWNPRVPYKLLQSASAQKVFLVTTTAQHKTRFFQTGLSITRSSASCSCLTTLTPLYSPSPRHKPQLHSYQQSLTLRTELNAPTQRATRHRRCCPRFEIFDILEPFRHLLQGLPATYCEKKKVRRALLARQLSVTMM